MVMQTQQDTRYASFNIEQAILLFTEEQKRLVRQAAELSYTQAWILIGELHKHNRQQHAR